MSLKRNIYIPIEVKLREYLPKLFFAYNAIKMNYRIYIGTKNEIFNLIKKKKNKGGIFFYKGGLGKKNADLIKKKCDLIAVMDEEIMPNMHKYMSKMSDKVFLSYLVKNRLNKRNVDKYYTSNKEINNAAKIVLKKKIDILPTGNLKTDLWRNENLYLHSNKIKKIKKEFKDFILFNSDFRYLHERSDYEENFDLSVYKSLKKDLKFIKTEMSNIKRFSKHLKITLIIRPHPIEDNKFWQKVIKKFKNIKLAPPTDDVIPYILASKGVLHNGCTTSNASIFFNKPTGYLIKDSNKFNKDYVIKDKLKYCFKISNSKNFNHWTNNLYKYRPLNSKNKKVFLKKINIQKKSVSAIVIKDLNNSKINKEEKIHITEDKINFFTKFLFKVRNEIKRVLNIEEKRLYISKIPTAITYLEAKKYLKMLNKISKRKEKFLVRQVKNNLIEIECS